MKKLLGMVLIFSMMTALIAGCGKAKEEDVTIRVAGLTGPTTMGMVGLMKADAEGTSANDYEFLVAGSADEVTPKLIQGELDIASVPANLASVLYNNSDGAVQVLAINTLGVLYIVEKGETIQSLSDLKGQTIYATGKGSTPEYNLRYLLSANGIDPDNDVTIEFKSEPNEVVALLAEQEGGIAMLPQPYVTVAKGNVEGLRVAISLNDEWNALGNGSNMVTGVVVARSAFVEEHPAAVAAFLKEYQASVDYVNANPEEAAVLIEENGIVKAAVAQKAIPDCNMTYLAGADMKNALQGYLQVLYDQNAKSVGSALPADDFYYEGK